MAARPIDFAAELERLSELTAFELSQEWRHHYRMHPPRRLSRNLLLRGVAYKIQERAFGGLSKALQRKLCGSGAAAMMDERRKPTRPPSIRPGTRLVREWRGVTHSVLVHADGVEWRGRRYRSLSVVAREITGAHWSGPRFFGLSGRAVANE